MDLMQRRRELLAYSGVVAPNLLDGVNWTARIYISDTGEERNSGFFQSSDLINLSAGTYKFSGLCAKDAEGDLPARVHAYSGNGTWIEMLAKQSAVYGDTYSLTFTVGGSTSAIRISTANPTDNAKLIRI